MALVELDEHVIVGLQIMALYNTGNMEELDCFGCDSKERLNCSMEDRGEKPVFFSPEFSFELTTCPLHCVPDCVNEFLDEYYHNENNNVVVGTIGQQCGRYHTASVLYRGYVNKLNIESIKKPKKEVEKGIGLSEVKKRFLK